MIYGQGIGTAKDLVRAAFWFELAGQDGSPEDKYTLGVMYSKGEPLEKNDVKARQWFERAANEGHVLAQYNLAVMYSEGLGAIAICERRVTGRIKPPGRVIQRPPDCSAY